MGNPLDEIKFPVWCEYADCDAGPFSSGDQVDEHICEEHLMEAVWSFAEDWIKPKLAVALPIPRAER